MGKVVNPQKSITSCSKAMALGIVLVHGMFLPLAAQTKLDLTFVDEESGAPMAARLELEQTKKIFKPKNGLSFGKLILVEGDTHWSPPLGTHRFLLERGPEYDLLHGEFTIEKFAEDAKTIRLKHRTSMRSEDWFSGDLLSLMPVETLKRWQQGEDLDATASMAAIEKSNQQKPSKEKPPKITIDDRSLQLTSGGSYWDRRKGSGLVLHRWQPSNLPDIATPSSQLLIEAKKQDTAIAEIQSLWARDVPIWLASKRIDLVQLLSEHLLPEEAKGLESIRNPDPIRFSGTKGLGRLVESIYWQMLEAGFRIPISAGSGFGDPKLDTHLGYNRVYVHLDEPSQKEEDWWEGLKRGNSFVTNGPLLRATVQGNYPGRIFELGRGQTIDLSIDLKLAVRDRVEYLDVIQNNRTIYQARLEQHMARGEFPPLVIAESGWVVIRVVTEHEKSYRLATTSPFYFEVDRQPRISRKAVQFFQDWLEDSAKQIAKEAPDPKAHQPYLDAARKFWQQRMEMANVE